MSNDNYLVKTDHASSIISKFSSYLRQGFLCDVVFICNKRRIVAHRLIVSTLSNYFQVLFENNQQIEIILNDIDPDIFENFILYAYEGHIDIQSINVIKILDTAHKFQINEIIETCCQFIKKQLQISNCLSLHRFALQHNLQDLTQTIWNYILDHFTDIIQNNNEFLELSYEEIKALLSSDDINVSSEEIVYEAFLSWLDYDLNRQKNHLSELFTLIRLPLIKRKYLTDYIDTNKRFENDSLCQMLIIEAMRYHLAPEKRSTMKSIRTKPRKSTLGVLYCLGGIDNVKSSQTIERYDFRTHSWYVDSQWNSRRCQFACMKFDKKLYICGGRDGLKTLNSVEIYDLLTKTWSVGSPMLNSRCDLGVECLSGPLYAIGGHDGRAILNTVERFDAETTEWTYVASMINVRCTFGVAVCDNRIYVVGGRDGSTDLRETEFFDPHTNRWSQCASMQKRRDRVAVVCCHEYLYAIGGHESSTINKSIIRHDDGERYDLKSNQWTLITSFSRPKEGLAIAAVHNTLYIVGGFDEKILNEMEKYEIETEQWQKYSSLGTKRTGACLIHVSNSVNQLLSQGYKSASNIPHAVNRRLFT